MTLSTDLKCCLFSFLSTLDFLVLSSLFFSSACYSLVSPNSSSIFIFLALLRRALRSASTYSNGLATTSVMLVRFDFTCRYSPVVAAVYGGEVRFVYGRYWLPPGRGWLVRILLRLRPYPVYAIRLVICSAWDHLRESTAIGGKLCFLYSSLLFNLVVFAAAASMPPSY